MYTLYCLIFDIVTPLLFLVCDDLSDCNSMIVSYATMVMIKEVLFAIGAFEFVMSCWRASMLFE